MASNAASPWHAPHGCCSVVLALALSLLPAAALGTAATPWRIAILTGTDPALPAAVAQDRAFRRALEEAAPHGVQFYTDPLDATRFQGADLMPEFLALLTKKYERQEVDLVVGIADFALDFSERYHRQVWPGKPVLILGMEEQRLRRRGLPADFAYLPLRIDVDGTLAIAEALQPQARRLVVIVGTTPFDLHWADRAAEAARQRTTRTWTPEIWSGVPMDELRDRLAALDRNTTAVVYPSIFRDRAGQAWLPFEAVKPMAQASAAPIYGWYPAYLENGLTAGSLVDFEAVGRRAGELAASILRGQVRTDGATLSPPTSRCTANVGRMEGLGLDVRALPAGCELAHQPPSLWRDYRGPVLAGLVVLGLQALTIAGLLVQHRRRRRAEDDAARRRIELNRAARVATVGELSASIAHEVGQPLGAIVTNTEVAELILKADPLDAAELQAIVADVRRDALRATEVVRRLRALLGKHAVAFAPLDLCATLEDAVALLTPEARRRRIVVERRFITGAAPLHGDPIQLQQVLLNLAINAMDAMHDTAAGERVLSLSLQPADGGFELQVADRGHGLAPDAQARLFESFYTTKPNGVGLGLSIVRTIVEAHGGRVGGAPRDGAGSVFTVWLPRAGQSARTQPAFARVRVPRGAHAGLERWRAQHREREEHP